MSATMLSTIAAAALCLGMQAGVDQVGSGAQPVAQPAGQPAVQPEGPVPAAKYDPAEDVRTVDGVMKALYACTAGAPGQPRDWDRLRNLCHHDMRFLAVRDDGGGGSVVFTLTVEDYIMHNKSYFEKGGFFESELARRTETFGKITHVWSTFESRLGSEDADPYTRGIYSVQLLKDGERWWVLSCSWDMERPDNPLPDEYLETPPEDGGR